MKAMKRIFLFLGLLVCVTNLQSEPISDDENLKGSIWKLIRNSSTNSFSGSGQVAYFLSSDAFQTYQNRKFQTWDGFSAVDSRNLVRIKKHEKIKMIESKFNGAIFQVKLLDGFYKNKTYYLIAEELQQNFKREIENDENV